MSAPKPPDAQNEHARRIAGYEILSKLGQGGMGAVYKARQLSLERMVALKVLPKQLTTNQDFIQRFSREARVTGQLNHPNIIKVYDVGRSNTGICYYSMEYVEGENLRSVLDREKRLGAETVLKVLEEMASALAHAHKHGIIHRDIKPDNILIDREGSSKLADLGLAKMAEDAGMTGVVGGGGYASMAGQVVGTPYYMSPEQAEGKAVDTRSDLYSLGATAFHLLAGSPPFVAETPMGVISKHLTEPVPLLRSRVPGVPPAVEILIQKLMAKDPAGRFQTPGEFLAEVSRIRREAASPPEPWRSAPASRGRAAGSRTPLLVGGGVLVVAAAATAMAMRGRKGEGSPLPAPVAAAPALPPPPISHPEKPPPPKEVVLENRVQPSPSPPAVIQPPAPPPPHEEDAFRDLRRRIHVARNDPKGLAALEKEILAIPPDPRTGQSHGFLLEECRAALRSAELQERLGEVAAADRGHAWQKVLVLGGTLQTELGPDPGALAELTGLMDRARLNRECSRRWTFDQGAEGWTKAAAIAPQGEKPRDPSGSLGIQDGALRFGPSGSNPRWAGEVRSPLFSLRPGARLSLRWGILLSAPGLRTREQYAYACLRDEKGQLIPLSRQLRGPVRDLLRFRDLGKDWKKVKPKATLDFRGELLDPRDLAAGREVQVRLCFGFLTDEPRDCSATMVLDDLEIFYGEDAP